MQRGPGHIYDHNAVAVHLLDKYVLGREHIYAGLVRIIENIPELLDELLRVRQVYRMKGLIWHLLHTQQDDAAVGVGEGRVSLPDTLWQSTQGFLCLNAVILPVLLNIGKIDHAKRLPFEVYDGVVVLLGCG